MNQIKIIFLIDFLLIDLINIVFSHWSSYIYNMRLVNNTKTFGEPQSSLSDDEANLILWLL